MLSRKNSTCKATQVLVPHLGESRVLATARQVGYVWTKQAGRVAGSQLLCLAKISGLHWGVYRRVLMWA